jgi:endonuclease IV
MENMRKNVEYILSFKEKLFPNVQFLFENTAGQGSELGSNLEELDLFMNKFMNKLDVKLTIDTCHSRA